MIVLDGANGGGQMLRTALALSAITKQPFTLENLRSQREQPGLKQQHLHCVLAVQQLCNAKTVYAELGSTKLIFVPEALGAKTLVIDIGTAGSIPLLLQAVLLPSLFAERDLRMKIIGGTDVQWSMPIDFVAQLLLPHLQRYGTVEVSVERRGYYPAGGGKVDIKVKQEYRAIDFSNADSLLSFLWDEKKEISLTQRGELAVIKGVSHCSNDLELQQVSLRQARAAKVLLNALECPVHIETQYTATSSPGSGIVLWANFVQSEEQMPLRIGADALGERGLKSELVGEKAAKDLMHLVKAGHCVDPHLADNLIPYLGLFGGEIEVHEVTNHIKTNIEVVEKFLPVRFHITGNLISVERTSQKSS